MELKDWIFLAILTATIVSSHLMVSKQIKKNKKSQWVDDFIRGIANYLALIAYTNYSSKKEELFEITKTGVAVLFLLDEKDQEQKMLHDAISYLTVFTMQELNPNSLNELENRVHEVKVLAKNIIKNEDHTF